MRLLVMLPFICLLAAAAAPTSEDLTTAAAVFAEARALSEADTGSLWGVQLYGPMLLVDPDTRLVMANQADDAGILRPNGTVFSGVLPDSVGVANTALSWGGCDWTMLMWPLPEDGFSRRTLVAHELWHRIQNRIGLPGHDPGSAHLVTYDGRLWLQLEWRALAAALVSRGKDRDDAVRDALAFRAHRRSVFTDSREAERQLELHEGLAEYTGFALSGRGEGNAAAAAEHLREAEGKATFVRSFAYASGPAYGLLLDAYAPTWREGLTKDDDLGDLLARHVDGGPRRTLAENTEIAVANYGGDVLIESERRRADKRLARVAHYRHRYVEGPVLRLDFHKMNVTFDPGEVDALEGVGNIYRRMRVTDSWGVLDVTDGGLITEDWRAAVVPAPDGTEGITIGGDGYTLTLAPGWVITPGEGGFFVEQESP